MLKSLSKTLSRRALTTPCRVHASRTRSMTSSSARADSNSSSHSHTSSLPPPPRSSMRKWASLLFGGAVATGSLSYAYYELVWKPRRDAPLAAMLVAMEPPEEYIHPYDASPWYWKTFFAAKRVCYLLLVMTPCLAVSVIVAVRPGDQKWREYWLEVLVSALDRAGCSFQKLGQWLSMRPDMFPPDVIRALSTLRSDTEPHSFAHTRRMIYEAFGMEIEELFEEFDEEPVASGTVAQVHRAVLKKEHAVKAWNNEGEPIRQVAVKVRHPQVLEEIWMDADIIYRAINMTKIMTVPFSKEEFLKLIQRQTDFKWEAYNLVQFAFNFRNEIAAGAVKFPEVSTSLLSESVLVESWASGKTVSSILDEVGDGFKKIESAVNNFTEALQHKKQQLARTVFDLNMKMFLRDNLMHADMHAGNILFDDEGNRCTVLDAGVTMSLDPSVIHSFGTFLHALCTGNASALCDKLIEFHVGENPPNSTALREDAHAIMSKWMLPDSPVSPTGDVVSLGDILGEMCFSMQRNGIMLRGDVATVMMSMSISEGLIRALDPDFDVVLHSLPYFVRFGTMLS